MKKINRYYFSKIFKYIFVLSPMLFVTNKVSQAIDITIKRPTQTSDISKLIENFLLWILSVAGSLALLILIVGGIIYITSSGDEQKITSAKKMINWTIFGLIIILASYSIIVVLNDILT